MGRNDSRSRSRGRGGGADEGKGGGKGADKGGGKGIERRDGDWDCPACGKLVFASKDTCCSCGEPKPRDGGRGGRSAELAAYIRDPAGREEWHKYVAEELSRNPLCRDSAVAFQQGTVNFLSKVATTNAAAPAAPGVVTPAAAASSASTSVLESMPSRKSGLSHQPTSTTALQMNGPKQMVRTDQLCRVPDLPPAPAMTDEEREAREARRRKPVARQALEEPQQRSSAERPEVVVPAVAFPLRQETATITATAATALPSSPTIAVATTDTTAVVETTATAVAPNVCGQRRLRPEDLWRGAWATRRARYARQVNAEMEVAIMLQLEFDSESDSESEVDAGAPSPWRLALWWLYYGCGCIWLAVAVVVGVYCVGWCLRKLELELEHNPEVNFRFYEVYEGVNRHSAW